MQLAAGCDALHRISELAEVNGIFARENRDLPEHPCRPFNSTAGMLPLVTTVERHQLETYHYDAQIGKSDVIRWTETCLPGVAETQVAEKSGRFEPATSNMNWSKNVLALHDMGCDDPAGLGVFAKDDSGEALEVFRMAFTV